MKNRSFPTFAVILLVFSVVWLLNELDVISFTLPWLPVILMVIAIGIIIDRFRR